MVPYAEILIIGDSPDQIALVSRLLHGEGYRVFAAVSGDSAWYFLERRTPDLILLDIHMKDVSGLEICRRMKSSKNSGIPIVFVTAETDKSVISRGFESGANDYIKKPFTKEEFLSRIRTQLSLAQRQKELIAANDELTRFTITVTHDLKAPFNIVNMLISKLSESIAEGNDTQTEMLIKMISDKATQAKDMIESLFEFSKLCNFEPKTERFNPKELITELFGGLMSLENPERKVEFICEDLPDIVADRVLFKEAVSNLFTNALKYSSKREQTVIRVSSPHDPAFNIIRVTDNGAGFDMNYANKLFKVFERLHSDREFPGTGVGLALVARIMEQHNGKITAVGEVDKGAEMSLYFPKSVKPTKG